MRQYASRAGRVSRLGLSAVWDCHLPALLRVGKGFRVARPHPSTRKPTCIFPCVPVGGHGGPVRAPEMEESPERSPLGTVLAWTEGLRDGPAQRQGRGGEGPSLWPARGAPRRSLEATFSSSQIRSFVRLEPSCRRRRTGRGRRAPAVASIWRADGAACSGPLIRNGESRCRRVSHPDAVPRQTPSHAPALGDVPGGRETLDVEPSPLFSRGDAVSIWKVPTLLLRRPRRTRPLYLLREPGVPGWHQARPSSARTGLVCSHGKVCNRPLCLPGQRRVCSLQARV